MRGRTNVIKKSDNSGNTSLPTFVLNAYSSNVSPGEQYVIVDCHEYSKINLEIFKSENFSNLNIDKCEIHYYGTTYQKFDEDFYISDDSKYGKSNNITINSNGTLSDYNGRTLTSISIFNYDIIKIGFYNVTTHRISLICTME